jgi:hypothetical protein
LAQINIGSNRQFKGLIFGKIALRPISKAVIFPLALPGILAEPSLVNEEKPPLPPHPN